MTIKVNFGYDTVTIPAAACAILERASLADIRILTALCADKRLRDQSEKEIASAVGIPEAQVVAAIAFWRGAGILNVDAEPDAADERAVKEPVPVSADVTAQPSGEPDSEPAQTETKSVPVSEPSAHRSAKPSRHDQLPNYTTDQINDLLESRPETADNIHEAEEVWGKMFNTLEINIILGLSDYLGLDWEYIFILLAYCRKLFERDNRSKSLHYVEKVAFGFYDEGIIAPAALTERIRKMETMAETEGQLRTMFGMGARALTAAEKKMFSAWLYDFEFGMDIIRKAYEITVDTIGESKPKYMNVILDKWHSEHLTTLEAVEQYAANNPQKKGKPKADTAQKVASSFETDDFFNAAVQRSFGTEFNPNDLNQ